MKIAVFNDKKNIEIIEIPDMEINDNQVLIKVEACAICTWEQRVYTGVKAVPFPFVGGHEIAAEVVKIGKSVDQRNIKVGDKVVHGTFLSCGQCHQCKMFHEENCEHFNHAQPLPGTQLVGMGGFSEYMVANPRNLYKIHDVNPSEASLVEPVSCCVHSVELANLQFGETVMVFGCGIMGLIHVQLALNKGCSVIAGDMNEARLEKAKTLGAHHTINNQNEDLESRIQEITRGKGINAIFNTTPISAVAQELQKHLSIYGRQILYSSFYPDNPIQISPDTLHKRATQLIGTANSNSRDFIRSISLVENGLIDLKPFITKEYAFEDIQEALDEAIKGESFRVVVKF